MPQKIDYTKYRKGSKSLHRLPIDYCPKCGKKGEHTFMTNNKTGQITDIFNHTGEIVTIGGFVMMEIKTSCVVKRERVS